MKTVDVSYFDGISLTLAEYRIVSLARKDFWFSRNSSGRETARIMTLERVVINHGWLNE
jgi:hypothetical protein